MFRAFLFTSVVAVLTVLAIAFTAKAQAETEYNIWRVALAYKEDSGTVVEVWKVQTGSKSRCFSTVSNYRSDNRVPVLTDVPCY